MNPRALVAAGIGCGLLVASLVTSIVLSVIVGHLFGSPGLSILVQVFMLIALGLVVLVVALVHSSMGFVQKEHVMIARFRFPGWDESPHGRIFTPSTERDLWRGFYWPFWQPGVQGISLRLWMPGFWRGPLLRLAAQLEEKPFLRLEPTECAVFTARDGIPLMPGEIFGKEVTPECLFDGVRFFSEAGNKGHLRLMVGPGGTHPYHTELYEVKKVQPLEFPTVEIDDPSQPGQKVKVPTFYRVQLLFGDEIVEGPGEKLLGEHVDGHDNFRDINVLIHNHAKRGWQEDIIEAAPGYVNPYAIKVERETATFIPEGFVGVQINEAGTVADPGDWMPMDDPVGYPQFHLTTKDKRGRTVTIPRAEVGILKDAFKDTRRGMRPDVYKPGIYNINPLKKRIIRVDTTEFLVCFDESDRIPDSKYPEAKAPSMKEVLTLEGEKIDIDFELTARVDFAPGVVGLSGSIKQAIRDYIVKTTESVVRTVVNKTPALKVIAERGKMEAAIKKELEVALGIRYFKLVKGNIVRLEWLDPEMVRLVKASTDLVALAQEKGVAVMEREVRELQAQVAGATSLVEADIASQAIIKRAGAFKAALDQTQGASDVLRVVALLLSDTSLLGAILDRFAGKKK